MTKERLIYQWCIALLLCFVQTAGIAMYGQDRPRAAAKRANSQQTDSLKAIQTPISAVTDSLNRINIKEIGKIPLSSDSLSIADSIAAENKRKMLDMTSNKTPQLAPPPIDSLKNALKPAWVPNPVKATWLALVIPGGGQIYNRKYWKLPIIYGGFAGCAYALAWNGSMYKDYAAAYKDAANGHFNTSNIANVLPPGYKPPSESYLTDLLRKRKDTYRRYRDLSIFAMIGVYIISVIDAYVDAELSNFDIGPDLSMRIEPTVINNTQQVNISGKSVGVQCSFRF